MLRRNEDGYGLDIDPDWRWRCAGWRTRRIGAVLLSTGDEGKRMRRIVICVIWVLIFLFCWGAGLLAIISLWRR